MVDNVLRRYNVRVLDGREPDARRAIDRWRARVIEIAHVVGMHHHGLIEYAALLFLSDVRRSRGGAVVVVVVVVVARNQAIERRVVQELLLLFCEHALVTRTKVAVDLSGGVVIAVVTFIALVDISELAILLGVVAVIIIVIDESFVGNQRWQWWNERHG